MIDGRFVGELLAFENGTVLGEAYSPASPAGSAGSVEVEFLSSDVAFVTLPGEDKNLMSLFVFDID